MILCTDLKSTAARRAFTRLDLLLGLVIVALVAAWMLRALAKTRTRVQRNSCAMIASDRDIEGGTGGNGLIPGRNYGTLFSAESARRARWSASNHVNRGSVALTDGSVHVLTNPALTGALVASAVGESGVTHFLKPHVNGEPGF
jgi:hypothetical protein